MDSRRVLLAIQEKLKWEERKARIEERLSHIREKKGQVLHDLEETRNRINQLTTQAAMTEAGRPTKEVTVSVESLR